jgi:hypothetical protein
MFFICQFCSARGQVQRYPVALSLKKSRRKRSAGAESASVGDVTRAEPEPPNVCRTERMSIVNSTTTAVSQRICEVTGWQKLEAPAYSDHSPILQY